MGHVQPETRLVNAIRDAIRTHHPNAWVMKVSGGPYQTAGIPDLLVCLDGRLTGIEVKRPHPGESEVQARNRVTPRQVAQLEALRRAGAVAGVAVNADEALTLIDREGK